MFNFKVSIKLVPGMGDEKHLLFSVNGGAWLKQENASRLIAGQLRGLEDRVLADSHDITADDLREGRVQS